MDIYREELIDNYQNPRNVGKIVDADAIIEVENISCGDRIELFIKVKNGKISEVMFDGEGCAIAIATASILTEYIKGQDLKLLSKMTYSDLEELIGVKLTPSRTKCANLSLESLHKALKKVDQKQIN